MSALLIVLLLAYGLYEAIIKDVITEIQDWRWRRSLPDEERYATCGHCGRRYDTTCLGQASEHWGCLSALRAKEANQ